MFRLFDRLSLGMQFGLLLAGLIAVVAVAGSILSSSIVTSQVLNEGRSVADMAEHIGKWASQYGGIHVKTTSTNPKFPGSYLEKYVYAVGAGPAAVNQQPVKGSALAPSAVVMSDMRADNYFWKNPALVQREVSDISLASPAKAKFRMTARSVLNKHNAPNEFEKEAMDAIWARLANGGDKAVQPAGNAAFNQKSDEYWKVEKGQLMYARALVAASSCLRCHGSRDTAPAFLRTNEEFNSGEGFGYQEGKPAGVISVSIPMPRTTEALAASLTTGGWAALGAILAFGVLILVFIARKVIAPINKLRTVAEALSNTAVSPNFVVPEMAKVEGKTFNEVHRLSRSVSELGSSVQILFRKMRQAKSEAKGNAPPKA